MGPIELDSVHWRKSCRMGAPIVEEVAVPAELFFSTDSYTSGSVLNHRRARPGTAMRMRH